jgi:hypothetical protein
MAAPDELTAKLGALDPVAACPGTPPPPFAAVLDRLDAPKEARLPRRSPALALVLAALAVSGTAAALAASGVIGLGTPASFPPPAAISPHSGDGMPEGGPGGLLALRVADPTGGPPWGLRYFTTSRGFGCLEVGRLVDGRLGLLGQDGIADDDGRLHPFAAGSLRPDLCAQRDGAGHTFLAVSGSSFYAAGVPFDGYPCSFGHRHACPAADRRQLLFGLLGPDGISVSYQSDGRTRTEHTAGPDGAYLIVLPATGHDGHSSSTGTMPSAPIVSVLYTGGRTCLVAPVAARAGGCRLVGYVAPALPSIPRRGIHTALTVATGAQLGLHRYRYRRVRVSFTAPVAIENATAHYQLQLRGSGACGKAMYGAQSDDDIRRGQRVVLEAQLPEREQLPTGHGQGPPCAGAAHGVVWLAATNDRANGRIDLETEGPSPSPRTTLGRFSIQN